MRCRLLPAVEVVLALLACPLVFAAGAVAQVARAGGGAELCLAKEGRSEYRIVVPAQATVHEMHAADELRSFIAQVTGAYLPVVTTTSRSSPGRSSWDATGTREGSAPAWTSRSWAKRGSPSGPWVRIS